MTNPTPYKVECPYCGSLELFGHDDQAAHIAGTWECTDCGGEFKPQFMPLDEYDEIHLLWWSEWNRRAANDERD